MCAGVCTADQVGGYARIIVLQMKICTKYTLKKTCQLCTDSQTAVELLRHLHHMRNRRNIPRPAPAWRHQVHCIPCAPDTTASPRPCSGRTRDPRSTPGSGTSFSHRASGASRVDGRTLDISNFYHQDSTAYTRTRCRRLLSPLESPPSLNALPTLV